MKTLVIDVVLADDHPGMIVGITHELSVFGTIRVRGCAHNSTELIELLESTPCDVIVSDYAMPAGKYGDGIQLFEFIGRRFPHVRLVVLTMFDNAAILGALDDLGVHGIVSKSDAVSHVAPAIHVAYSGSTFRSPTVAAVLAGRAMPRNRDAGPVKLSPREAEVVRLFVSGMRIDEIAEQLKRSKKTISTQKSRAMAKLGLSRDTDLVRYALEQGWLASSRSTD
ncbi:DNA-binding response regulator [Burkholderia ubonensis]|uniref:DNA-binding response regulator n=2 Tax=Burkholderia ubonensis TaxID=101571 RepID=A0A1R1J6B0_9BURK|nr:DNA-binding response regulator [Burkholderia ubonensis]